jgi:membrane protease YdiL (CAAX protease family)
MGIFRRHILPWSLAFFVLGFVLLYEVPSFPQLPYLVDAGVQRVILTAATFVMIWLLGGATVLKPSPVGMRSALREAGYPVIVSLGLCALDLVADASIVATYGTSVLSSTWLLNIFEALFLCAFVGLFEEGLVRVLLFCGILSRGGGSRNGLVVAAFVSSLVFGAIHVLPVRGTIDNLLLVQMLLKTVQAGLIGLLLASTFLRTHSYYGVALVHCLADFLLFVPEVIFDTVGTSGGYVSQTGGIEAIVFIVSYVFAVVLYLPAVFKSMRLLDDALVPDYGCFVECWVPRESEAFVPNASPLPPDGLAPAPVPAPAPSPLSSQGFPSAPVPLPPSQTAPGESTQRRMVPQYPPGWPRG